MRPGFKYHKLWLSLIVAPLSLGLLLALVEAALWVVGVAEPPHYFSLSTDDGGARWLVAGDHSPRPEARFRTQRISLEKDRNTLRIVCLGDSTTYGLPFDLPAPFSCWLEERLSVLLPEQTAQVLNLGGPGLDARAILSLFHEVAVADADLYVLYCGHNELLESNLPAALDPWSDRARRLVEKTRLGRTLLKMAPRSPDAALVEVLRRSDTIRREPPIPPAAIDRACRNFEASFRALIEAIHGAGRKALICLPVSDAVDTPPQVSCFSRVLTEAQQNQFQTELDRLRAERRQAESDPQAAMTRVDQALSSLASLTSIDPSVAAVHYERARWLLLRGDLELARKSFERALDADSHPIRATSRIRRILLEIAAELAVPSADPLPLFVREARGSLPRQQGLFVDYCHPDLRGHELIADSILACMKENDLPVPRNQLRTEEPSREEYRLRMGFRDDQQAAVLARQALFALGQGFFDPDSEEVAKAHRFLDLSLSIDAACAPAHVGRGFIAILRNEPRNALDCWTRAWQIAPQELAIVEQSRTTNPEIDRRIRVCGIELDSGTLEPRIRR